MGRRDLAACLMLSIVLTACVDDDGPALIVVGNITPDGDCLFRPDRPARLRGIFDTSAACSAANRGTHGYMMGLRVENQLISRGSPRGLPPPIRANPNQVNLRSAEVELLRTQGTELVDFGGALPNPFTVAVSGSIPSAQDTTNGIGFVIVPAIPPDYTVWLREGLDLRSETLTVRVRLMGETAGGVEVRASPFEFVVDVCERCLTVPRTGIPSHVQDSLENDCNSFPGSDTYCVE